MSERSWAYEAYMASNAWRWRRREALWRARHRCERCGAWRARLEVHHRTYRRLGAERNEDLEVLCPDCHRLADAERRNPRRTP